MHCLSTPTSTMFLRSSLHPCACVYEDIVCAHAYVHILYNKQDKARGSGRWPIHACSVPRNLHATAKWACQNQDGRRWMPAPYTMSLLRQQRQRQQGTPQIAATERSTRTYRSLWEEAARTFLPPTNAFSTFAGYWSGNRTRFAGLLVRQSWSTRNIR